MNNQLKRKLGQNETTIGSWITIGSSGIAEIMSNAGFDWLTIDLEHSVIDLFEAESLIRTIDLCGCSPLVRLSENDSVQIKRVMDAGAHGVIVPMVKNAEDAIRAVESVYYPTKGNRGVGLARAQGYGSSFQNYKNWLEDNAVVIVQVEHIQAALNLEEIIQTPGIDGFILGPYDLSASMGKPGQFEDKDVQSVMSDVLEKARLLDKPAGIHIIEPDPNELTKRIAEGFTFIAYSLDIRMLDMSSRQGVSRFKNLFENSN
jgi:2-dehydro-3-deoxyglucarate aldolase